MTGKIDRLELVVKVWSIESDGIRSHGEWLYANDVVARDARELAKALRTVAAQCGDQKEPTLIVEGEARTYHAHFAATAYRVL